MSQYERPEVVSIVTSYSYSVGSLNQVTNGKEKRTSLRHIHSLDKLLQNKGLILIPRVIGIYQTEEFLRKDPE